MINIFHWNINLGHPKIDGLVNPTTGKVVLRRGDVIMANISAFFNNREKFNRHIIKLKHLN